MSDVILTFGKFKGKTLAEVPDYYIRWLLNPTIRNGEKPYPVPEHVVAAAKVINDGFEKAREHTEYAKQLLGGLNTESIGYSGSNGKTRYVYVGENKDCKYRYGVFKTLEEAQKMKDAVTDYAGTIWEVLPSGHKAIAFAGKRSTFYEITREGYVHSVTAHASYDDAIAQLRLEYPKTFDEDVQCNVQSTPDPEDDQILIWEILPSGHRKVVWKFIGWHHDGDAHVCHNSSLYEGEDGLYAIAMRDC